MQGSATHANAKSIEICHALLAVLFDMEEMRVIKIEEVVPKWLSAFPGHGLKQ